MSVKFVCKTPLEKVVLDTICTQVLAWHEKPPLVGRLKYQLRTGFLAHRGDRIRTCGILLPKQARYQTAPLPDCLNHSAQRAFSASNGFGLWTCEGN